MRQPCGKAAPETLVTITAAAFPQSFVTSLLFEVNYFIFVISEPDEELSKHAFFILKITFNSQRRSPEITHLSRNLQCDIISQGLLGHLSCTELIVEDL